MLYELARRLKEEGRTADQIRAELKKVGATKDEIDVLIGSLGLAAPTMTAAPELMSKTSRVASSRWLLGFLFLLLLAVLGPVIWVVWTLIDAARVGR